jgi:dethiobiotin synthetase
LFITGTDTGVGKTHLARLLVESLHGRSERIRPRKPVESGCRREGSELLPADGIALWEATGRAEPLEAVCPYRLEHALAPDRAARLERVTLKLSDLVEACHGEGDAILIVEGAGGFLSPLTDDGLNADLAVALGLPVLLVAADRLGCINHVLLTAESIAARGLELAAVVLNPLPGQPGPEGMDNLVDLQERFREKVARLAPESGPARDQLWSLSRIWLNC